MRTWTPWGQGAETLPAPTLHCWCDGSVRSVQQRVHTLAFPVSAHPPEPGVRLSALLYLESHSPYFVMQVMEAVRGSLPPGARGQQPRCVWRPRGTEMAQAGFQCPVRSTPWPNWVLPSPQHPSPPPPEYREGSRPGKEHPVVELG